MLTLQPKVDFGSSKNAKLLSKYYYKSFKGNEANKRIGSMSLSATGLGGTDTLYKVKDDFKLNIEGYQFKNPTKISLVKNQKYKAYIGLNWFKTYGLTVNSTESKYVLSNYSEAEFKTAKKYGLTIYPIKDTLRIIQIDLNESDLVGIELLSKVEIVEDNQVLSFDRIFEYRKYMKGLKNNQQSLFIRVNELQNTIEFPYKEMPTITLK
jgi:hypothetical protein